jgi:hypothetical protein
MSIKVTCEVPTYDNPATPSVRVLSDWIHHNNVILKVGEQEVTVDATELIAAVRNAINKA